MKKRKQYPKIEKVVDIIDKTAVSAVFKLLDCLATIGSMGLGEPYEHIRIPRRESKLRAQGLGKKSYYVTVHRCVKRGWVKKAKKDGKLFLKLTAQGQLHLLRQRLKHGLHTRKAHDGSFWLILFDIPEIASRERDALRRFLREIKFHQLQKSVYISPYPIPQEAFAYLEQTDLRRFIRCMRVSEVDNRKDFQHLLSEQREQNS